MTSNNWTEEEVKILKKYYPQLGSKVKEFLPNRTLNAIDHKVRNLGLKYTGGLHDKGESGYFDIETSGLQGDFNYMISWCIKTANKDEIHYGLIKPEEIYNGTLDKRIVKELVDTLKKYKRIYTFYGTRFDVKFARTRALANGLEFVPYGLVEHRDLYYLVRRIFKIHRNRLETVCDLLGIKGKTHLEPSIWIKANSGNKEALEYILNHNKKDVEILEKMHKKIVEYEASTRRYI